MTVVKLMDEKEKVVYKVPLHESLTIAIINGVDFAAFPARTFRTFVSGEKVLAVERLKTQAKRARHHKKAWLDHKRRYFGSCELPPLMAKQKNGGVWRAENRNILASTIFFM